jgi:hypothetical protein
VGIEEGKAKAFVRFMTESLGRYDGPLAAPYIASLRTRVDGAETTVYFLYGEGQMDLGRKKTINIIRVSKEPGREVYSVTLDSKGLLEATNSTGTFVRKILLRWPPEHL